MSNKALYIIWGGLYILCAGLGFMQPGAEEAANAMTLLSVAFFIPGAVLLYRGQKVQIRLLSAISLGLTVVCILLNILSVGMAEIDGRILYTLLGLLSAPMFCSRMWLLSLFLWACLLMGSFFLKDRD